MYKLRTIAQTLPEFESALKSKLGLEENIQILLRYKEDEVCYILNDIDDLVEGMKILVSIPGLFFLFYIFLLFFFKKKNYNRSTNKRKKSKKLE